MHEIETKNYHKLRREKNHLNHLEMEDYNC